MEMKCEREAERERTAMNEWERERERQRDRERATINEWERAREREREWGTCFLFVPVEVSF